jgi:hypothetical protein
LFPPNRFYSFEFQDDNNMCVNGRRVSCLMSHLVGGKAYATFSSDGDIKVSAPLPRKP